MIPYHVHLIWIGPRFPFVNRLAVESVLMTNPEARVTIHYRNPPTNPHWNALSGRVELRELVLPELVHGLDQDGPAITEALERSAGNLAGASDILRYLILHRHGGIYLDFDTLTLRDFQPLLGHSGFVGEETVFRHDDDRILGRFGVRHMPGTAAFLASWGLCRASSLWLGNPRVLEAAGRTLERFWAARKLNGAVLGAEPKHPFIRTCLTLCTQEDASVPFNLGPIMLNRVWTRFGDLGMTRLPESYFYAIPPSQTIRFFAGKQPPLPAEAYVAHYCYSNEKQRAERIQPAMLARQPGPRDMLFHHLAHPVVQHLGLGG